PLSSAPQTPTSPSPHCGTAGLSAAFQPMPARLPPSPPPPMVIPSITQPTEPFGPKPSPAATLEESGRVTILRSNPPGSFSTSCAPAQTATNSSACPLREGRRLAYFFLKASI